MPYCNIGRHRVPNGTLMVHEASYSGGSDSLEPIIHHTGRKACEPCYRRQGWR